jgi:hypothetical protein
MDINVKIGEHGGTALVWAAMVGHKAVVELLLCSYYIKVNAETYNNLATLMWSAAIGHAAVVELLLMVENMTAKGKETQLHGVYLGRRERSYCGGSASATGGQYHIDLGQRGGWTVLK